MLFLERHPHKLEQRNKLVTNKEERLTILGCKKPKRPYISNYTYEGAVWTCTGHEHAGLSVSGPVGRGAASPCCGRVTSTWPRSFRTVDFPWCLCPGGRPRRWAGRPAGQRAGPCLLAPAGRLAPLRLGRSAGQASSLLRKRRSGPGRTSWRGS